MDLLAPGVHCLTLVVDPEKVMTYFPKGTDTYNAICDAWVRTYLTAASKAFALAVVNHAAGLADPTGIVSLIQAFNNPKCSTHVAFPY